MPDCADLPTPDVGVVQEGSDLAATRPDPTLVGKLYQRLAMRGKSLMTARVARARAKSILTKVAHFAGRTLGAGSQETPAVLKGRKLSSKPMCVW